MAVGSGQTVAETQQRGPEELHIAGPVQAGRGRGARQGPGSRWAFSPARSAQHSDFAVGTGLTDLAPAPPTPPFGPAPPGSPPRPPPRPARCCPGAWGLGRWRRGAPAAPGPSRRELRVRSLAGLRAAFWAGSGLWACVPPRRAEPAALRTRGGETRLLRAARGSCGAPGG